MRTITNGNTNKGETEQNKFNFNPFLPEFRTDPYPFYHRLRSEDPVHRSFMGVWVLTRYADVKATLHDPRFCVSLIRKQIKDKKQHIGAEKFEILEQNLDRLPVLLDPPNHSRLRKLASKALSPSFVEHLHPQIQEIVNGLIAKVRDRGSMDIVADLAYLLPTLVMAKILDVPDEIHSQLRRWSQELVKIFDPLMPLEAYEQINSVTVELSDYFRSLIIERKKRPKDDLISTLIGVRVEGDKLSEDELLSLIVNMCGGSERNTVNLLGNGMLTLLLHPAQMEKLKKEPGIISNAVEELMRYEPSAQIMTRVATEDVQIDNKTIRAGEQVYLCLGAANRDPDQFINPDALDLTRGENRHLTLGGGIHLCLGAAQARSQIRIAINTMVQQLPNLKLMPDPLEWQENITSRGLKALPVTFSL